PVSAPPAIHPLSLHDALPILDGVVFLPFASSEVEGFFEMRGRPCPRFTGEIHDFFAGWQSGREEEPICDHDTFEDSTRPASLVLDRKSTRLNSSHLVISYAVF